MAAEASRALAAVREQTIASPFRGADPLRRAINTAHDYSLRLFGSIPAGHGAIEVDGTGGGMLQPGEVAVYERPFRDEIRADDLIEGEIYVYEHQRPIAESPHPGARQIVTRRLVRVYRHTDRRFHSTDGAAWYARQLNQPFRPGEGTYHDWGLASMLIGRVVGVYAPAQAGGAA